MGDDQPAPSALLQRLGFGSFVFDSRERRAVLKASAAGILAFSVIVVVYAILVPDLGLDVFPQAVRKVHSEPVQGSRPRVGDLVTAVAGVRIDSLPRYVNTLAHLRSPERFPAEPLAHASQLPLCASAVAEIRGTRYVRVDFLVPEEEAGSRAGTTYSSWFEVRGIAWQTLALSLAWLVLEAGIFWLGWLVYHRRPEDDAAALFFLMCIVTVGAYMGGYHWLKIASNPALTFVFALCAMAVPQVSFHFYSMFPTPKPYVKRYAAGLLVGLYVVPGVLQIALLWTIGSVVSDFRHSAPAEHLSAHLTRLNWLIWAYLSLGASMFTGCVGCLLHSYFTTRDNVHRNQVRWILTGALVASFFLAYAFWLAVRYPSDFVLGGARLALFLASLAFTTAYAVSITRYRLLLAEEVLQRTPQYLLISFTITATYCGLILLAVWLGPQLVTHTLHGQALIVTLFVLVVLLSVDVVRRPVQKALDRRFFREKQQLERALRRMDQAVDELHDRSTVVGRCLAVLADLLPVRMAAVYLKQEDHYRRVDGIEADRLPELIRGDNELIQAMEAGLLLHAAPGAVVLPGDRVTPILRRLGLAAVQPFVAANKRLGFLVIGPREEGMYSPEELSYSGAVAELTAVALHGAETQRMLERLNGDLQRKVAWISQQRQQLLTLQARMGDEEREPGASRRADARLELGGLVGSSQRMRDLIETVRKIASSEATTLIRGESGTGKSVLAEVIHRNSPRASGPFVKVHCAALSPGVLESELFGHVRGAFTGALRDKVGRFQLADRGTLFLDEIGDVSLDIQTKLLRVLQERTFEAVGSSEPIRVDVRIIAATHQPLEELVRRGKLREDLFYRLNVISIVTPPLRQRREDILELALHFLRQHSSKLTRPLDGFDDAALELLQQHDWPGNIRELENVIERAVVLADGPRIQPTDLPPELCGATSRSSPAPPTPEGGAEVAYEVNDGEPRAAAYVEEPSPEPAYSPPSNVVAYAENGYGSAAGGGLTDEIDRIERGRLADALRRSGGNKTKAARLLGMPRSTYCSKLKKHGLDG